ncbi:type II toxin-antitoxin system RelE/ParE family toxin [Roseateles saccharophilus]|uniref:ParE-like toxin of type II ParDE toxin-antitoxin system n=1 Tax=Roseateles saccharophilus TaxID=304 RepID=A0A4R3UID4_ROSSA|nr:type II toxin-antitoxin system RelE/ParE family toxin [Roseateles saccharophilus]MDG0834888.1 type II toxin-antitoxin system RelE/ParE family toxin [Roseateles saccharophilus]TCU88892.1 ParE-like toxin of type II ParDE toxin-antitoxin system [Roseateles saccharophilus]
MTSIEFERGALRDLDRITDFLMTHDADHALERKDELLAGILVLRHAPEIGRRASTGTRELVIGRAARGYVVRYRYLQRADLAVVVAIRHQRESR